MLGHLTPGEAEELELVDVDAAGQTSIGVPGEQMPLMGLAPAAVPELAPGIREEVRTSGYSHAFDILATLNRKERDRMALQQVSTFAVGYYVMDEVGQAGAIAGPFDTPAQADADKNERNIADDCGVWYRGANGIMGPVPGYSTEPA